MLQETHGCFSCRQCSVTEDGKQCPSFHHSLLHQSANAKVGVALTQENEEALHPIIAANISCLTVGRKYK